MFKLEDYDLFLVDIWGVLYNNDKAYPKANETLKKLRLRNKVVLFSNSPALPQDVENLLSKIGISEYDDIITSGLVGKIWLKNQNKKHKNFVFESEKLARSIVEEDEIESEIHNAERILLLSFPESVPTNDHGLEILKPTILKALEKNLEMICLCCDTISVNQNKTEYAAGKIAEIYQKLGGKAFLIGKPWPIMYEYAFNKFNTRKILAFGDSLPNDILGAYYNEIDAVWIENGIHQNDEKEKVFAQYNIRPKFSIPYFSDLIEKYQL
jgi:HAD superfamily hydrolase (TIGR01459 family)